MLMNKPPFLQELDHVGCAFLKNMPFEKTNNPFWLGNRTVIAGVDLKGITSKDMDINEETKEIDITLPHAELIQDPSVQMDKIQALDKNGLFRADIKMKKGFDLAAEAQEKIRQGAISSGLLDTAEKNSEKVLKEFFKNIGYTVNVTFN